MCIDVCLHVCVLHALQRSEEDVGSSGPGVMIGVDHRVLGTEPEQVLLISEPSPQLLVLTFYHAGLGFKLGSLGLT